MAVFERKWCSKHERCEIVAVRVDNNLEQKYTVLLGRGEGYGLTPSLEKNLELIIQRIGDDK